MMDRSDGAAILVGMPLISRMRSGRVRRLEEQMRAMNSKIDEMAETFESRRADDEAAAIAAERIRSGAADHEEDGAEALASLGIKLPEG
jgi:TolA-binding protein